jgi:predicted metal-binding protein
LKDASSVEEKGDKVVTKLIGIVQCDVAKERCSGLACINSFDKRIDAFEGYEASGIMAVPFNCGGAPGRRIGRSAAHLARRAEHKAGIKKEEIVIHLASCVATDNGHYPPCPHLDYIVTMLKRKGFRIKMGSYKSNTAERRRGEGRYEAFDWGSEG